MRLHCNGDLHVAVVKGSDDKVLDKWTMDAPILEMNQVLMPNESIPGKVLTVESAEDLFRAEGLCHEIEHETFITTSPTNFKYCGGDRFSWW